MAVTGGGTLKLEETTFWSSAKAKRSRPTAVCDMDRGATKQHALLVSKANSCIMHEVVEECVFYLLQS
jgi:hypothetical protein